MAGKGKPKTGGRKKGTTNKLTGDVKAMVLAALDRAHAEGGTGYLIQQSRDNPVAFMSLVGRVLPLQVQGDPNAPLISGITVQLVKPAD